MSVYELLLWIAGGMTAAGVIYKGVKTIVLFFWDLRACVKKTAEHTDENYLSILRLTVMSSDMPMSERLIAGKKYVAAGGNGEVKEFYHELERKANASDDI